MIGTQHDADRGVSIALTHVLTIGITTILIAMLLMSGSTMLESETDRSAQTSLETVGERLSGEIANVDQIADGNDTVTITAEHPRSLANSQYTVELLKSDECDGENASLLDDSNPCVRLTAQDHDVTVYTPVAVNETRIEDASSATGGVIEITYNGDNGIEITEADR